MKGADQRTDLKSSLALRMGGFARGGFGRVPLHMDLSQDQVAEFLQSDKVAAGFEPIAWNKSAPRRIMWAHSVRIDGVELGLVRFFVNAQLPRSWHFKLLLHSTEIYRLDVKPKPASHSNPPKATRPAGYPRKVECPQHEHNWFPEHPDLRCALPIPALDGANHEECLREFCKRTRITFEPEYRDPTSGVQLGLSQ